MEQLDRPSKSQRKRDNQALQETGVQLVALNADQLARLGLPERLLSAVVAAQRIRDFEGRRRQMQYIGKLMREVDPAPIRAKLAQWHGVAREHTATQHLIERWRVRLLSDDGALTQFAAEYPRGELQRLRSLVASVKRERAAGRAPRNYRELFRVLREIIARPLATENTEDPE